MPTAVRSHAKINLGLGIGAPRADGFHMLVTVYQTLEVYDVVTVAARPAAATVLRLTSNNLRVPTDGRNTAWKMVALALEVLRINAEVEIHIEKRLPVQGGLGAGSANAMAALVGLEAELGVGVHGFPPFRDKAAEGWGTQLVAGGETAGHSTPLRSAQDDSVFGNAQDDRSLWPAWRMEIAAKVGSDVPLFLIGGTILGLDRGQQVSPLPDLEPVWCVVATPELGVSTPQAFRDWDALCAVEGLTPEEILWHPSTDSNSIGLILFHVARSLDASCHTRLQNKPQLWESGKWYQKLNKAADDRGAHYTAEQVDKFTLDTQALKDYFKAVQNAYREFVSGVTDEKIGQKMIVPAMGPPAKDGKPRPPVETNVGSLLVMGIMHMSQHAGEISYIRGLNRGMDK